jgi:predicted Zn-dependent protease
MRNNSQQGLKKGEISQLQNVQLLINLTTKVIAPSWQRGQERAADLLGTDLMIKAGYNPDGMSDLMSVLKQSYENNKKDPNPLKLADLAANVAMGDNAQKMNAGIEMLAMAFGSDHPDPQTRMDDVSEYLGKHYDDAETIKPYRRTSWDALMKSTQLRKVVLAYDGAVSAKELLDRNKPKEAYDLSRKTVEGARNHAYPAYVHAMTLYGVGKMKEGDEVLRYVFDNATEPSGQVYAMWASTLESSGRYKEALAVSEKGYERLGQAPQMVPMRVRYQRMSGDQKGAHQSASECARILTDYRDACLKEANPPPPAAAKPAANANQPVVKR